MTRGKLFAFDCGTTNWRIQQLSYEETGNRRGPYQIHPLSEPQRVALTTFKGHYLPAALVLNERGQVHRYGSDVYDPAYNVKFRPYIRDTFKPCIGNREGVNPLDPRRRYSHDEALRYTRLLLEKVIEQLEREKPGSLTPEHHFYFAHPVHWGREEEDGRIDAQPLADFAHAVRSCFPELIRTNVHFVPEPEAALISLAQSGQLKLIRDKYTLIVDAGGGTTDFVAGRLTPTGLQEVRYDGDNQGGRLFDHDLAHYLAELLHIPENEQTAAWPELCYHACQLKESLSRQVGVDETQKISRMITLALPSGLSASYRTEAVEFGRAEFEVQTEQTRALFERLVFSSLVNMDLRRSEIGQVVLVGGGANLYLVPRLLRNIFGNSAPVVFGDPPDETIVRGAALWYTQQTPSAYRVTPASPLPNRPLLEVEPTIMPPMFEPEIDSRYEAQRQTLLTLMDEYQEIGSTLSALSPADIVHDLKIRLQADQFRIIVLGSGKTGKSSLINAFLQAEILPAYATPCTALITEIKWAESPRALLHPFKRAGKASMPPKEILPEQLEAHLTLKSAGNQDELRLTGRYEKLELFWPFDLGRHHKVEFIDIPNLDVIEYQRALTPEFLKTGDAFLFVLNSQALLSIPEQELIAYLHTLGYKDLFFLCNRFDELKTGQQEQTRRHALAKLAPRTQPYGADRVFFVSALAALEGYLQADRIRVEQSNLPLVETALAELFTVQRAHQKLLPVAAILRSLIHNTHQAANESGSPHIMRLDTLENRLAEFMAGI